MSNPYAINLGCSTISTTMRRDSQRYNIEDPQSGYTKNTIVIKQYHQNFQISLVLRNLGHYLHFHR